MAEEPAKKSKTGLICGVIAAIIVAIIAIIIIVLNATPKVVGKYKLSAFINDGKESTEMVSFVEALGGKYTIEFKKDKTGTLEMTAGEESEVIEFKYDDKKLTAEKDGEKKEMPYEYKDDTVTVTFEGEGMKFSREKDNK